jgi:hypothetical protein
MIYAERSPSMPTKLHMNRTIQEDLFPTAETHDLLNPIPFEQPLQVSTRKPLNTAIEMMPSTDPQKRDPLKKLWLSYQTVSYPETMDTHGTPKC